MINFNFNSKSALFLKIVMGITAAAFLGLVIFEQINDKYRFKKWNKDSDTRIQIGSGRFECGKCGNRKITKNDRSCPVCGLEFRNIT